MIRLSSLDTLHNGTLVGHLQQKSQIIWTGKWFKLIIDYNSVRSSKLSASPPANSQSAVRAGGQLAGEC